MPYTDPDKQRAAVATIQRRRVKLLDQLAQTAGWKHWSEFATAVKRQAVEIPQKSQGEKKMTTKYTLQHVGYPVAGRAIEKSEWKTYSEHASEDAAFKAMDKATAHLQPGQWDDHYRVISPRWKNLQS